MVALLLIQALVISQSCTISQSDRMSSIAHRRPAHYGSHTRMTLVSIQVTSEASV